MIMRSWNAVATEPGSLAFAHHFSDRVLPRLRTIDGFLGAYLLDRSENDLVGLSVLTFWDSPEALAAHTGTDLDAVVIDADALRALLDFESEATHHHVAARWDGVTDAVMPAGQVRTA